MAALVFPPSPSLNDTFIGPYGEVYTWDGERWTLTGASPFNAGSLISTDPGNTLVLGTDNLLYDPPGSGGGGGVPTDVTGTGTTFVLQDQPTVNQPITMGVIDGSDAPPGAVGEYLVAELIPANAIPIAAAPLAFLGMVLTPGDWDAEGFVRFTAGLGPGAVQAVNWWISTTPNVVAPAVSAISRFIMTSGDGTTQTAYGMGQNSTLFTGTFRFNVAVSTTIYLQAHITSTTSPGYSVCGKMWARRMR